jgi:sugar lactone lactonase YvrE
LRLTDSGTPRACDGRLIRVPPQGGQGERVDVPPLHYPNGLAFDRAGHLLVVETFTPRLSWLDDSGLSTVADLKWVVPDGVPIDADGDAIIGCYYPFRLLRVNSKGVSMLVDDPFGFTLQMPTNVAFFGERLDQLAIAALGGWSITTLQMPTPGAPLVYP